MNKQKVIKLTKNCIGQQDCKKCPLKHCNGQVHKNRAFIYPVCHICGIELLDLIELLQNDGIRNKNNCEICLIQYKTLTDWKSHFFMHFDHTRQKLQSIFHCISCAEKLNIDPFEYVNASIPIEIETIKTEDVTSTLPNEDNKRFSQLKALVKYDPNSANDNDMEIEILEELVTLDNSDDKRYPCSQCTKKFGTELECDFHIKHYHDDKCNDIKENSMLKCMMCDETFLSKLKRSKHIRDVHRNSSTNLYDCLWCERNFKSISGIIGHTLIHNNEEMMHNCDICGKKFQRLSNLQGHYATHNDDNSYSCKLCNKKFKTMQLRKKHWRNVHIEEKPLKCEHCDKRYKDHSDLRRHRWKHGGYEKKFQCNLCDRKFFEAKLLRIHMRTHEKEKNIENVAEKEKNNGNHA